MDRMRNAPLALSHVRRRCLCLRLQWYVAACARSLSEYFFLFQGLGQLGFRRAQRTDFEREYRFTPSKVPFLYGVTAIRCGSDHNLALDASGNVFAWGNNDNGQLGLGRHQQETEQVGEARSFDLFDHEEARPKPKRKFVDVATRNEFLRDKSVVDIKCGGTNSGVLTEAGALYTFGYNFWHQSIGTAMHIAHPQLLQSFAPYSHLKVESADLGMSHTLFLTSDNELYAVGNNNYAQCSRFLSEKEVIPWPCLLSSEELGIDNDAVVIQRVIAGNLSSFIFVS